MDEYQKVAEAVERWEESRKEWKRLHDQSVSELGGTGYSDGSEFHSASSLQRAYKKAPKPPTVITSQEDYTRYEAELKDFVERAKTISALFNEAQKATSAYEKELKALLPKNGWVKVGDLCYGLYLDVWGGSHYEIDRKPYAPDMQPPQDRTYYP